MPAWFKSISYGVVSIGVFGIGFLGPLFVGLLSAKFGLQMSLVYVMSFYLLSAIVFIIAGFFYLNDYLWARDEEASKKNRIISKLINHLTAICRGMK